MQHIYFEYKLTTHSQYIHRHRTDVDVTVRASHVIDTCYTLRKFAPFSSERQAIFLKRKPSHIT